MGAPLARLRVVRLMVPAAGIDGLLVELAPLLQAGDTVVDGGNTNCRDDIPHAAELQTRGIHHVDVGTSGSVAGLYRGYCLMVGGEALQLLKDPELGRYAGRVSDSGEGRWTLQAAIDEGVPVPVPSAALFARSSSRGGGDFANRVLSAMREEIGGHAEKSAA